MEGFLPGYRVDLKRCPEDQVRQFMPVIPTVYKPEAEDGELRQHGETRLLKKKKYNTRRGASHL